MHEKRIDLRWRDLDAYGHVNQAVYLTFAEEVLDRWFQQKLGMRPGSGESRPLTEQEGAALSAA
jgi:acyl-CoA thioesterase FadM